MAKCSSEYHLVAMPHLGAFSGIRYARAGHLGRLVCPPYDVISPADQERLHSLHPHNAVRIELPFSESHDIAGRYAKAASQFEKWLSTGVLVQDPSPRMYVYRQDFIWNGQRKRVAGVIGSLLLEDFGKQSGILPHEKTMPGPIEDRLALLRACPVNISPIYGIYRGGGSLAPFYDALTARPPTARLSDEHKTLHRLWVIDAPAEQAMLSEALESSCLVIADGHHRYETALAYHREQDGSQGDHGTVMCFCADADVEDLNVLPYHRAVRAPVQVDQLQKRLRASFDAKELAHDIAPRVFEHSAADHSFLVMLEDKQLLIEVVEDQVTAAVGDQPAAWRSLDVVALHETVFPTVFPEGIDEVRFSSDADEVARLVTSKSWLAGFCLKPLNAVQVVEVARAAVRMPQKASYFWPKAVTGLVFHSLR